MLTSVTTTSHSIWADMGVLKAHRQSLVFGLMHKRHLISLPIILSFQRLQLYVQTLLEVKYLIMCLSIGHLWPLTWWSCCHRRHESKRRQSTYNHLTLSVDFYSLACLAAGVSSHNRKYIQVHPSFGAKVAHGAFPWSPGHSKVALRIQSR